MFTRMVSLSFHADSQHLKAHVWPKYLKIVWARFWRVVKDLVSCSMVWHEVFFLAERWRLVSLLELQYVVMALSCWSWSP